ncbi:MAG: NAD(P)-binding domain-containing protein [Planctomycetes bacterium]|nr:NAD(P)-binding domain-containing protein [Planctomycetota bacterium]
MAWTPLLLCVFVGAALVAALRLRRRQLAELRENVAAVAQAKERGAHQARLQFPHIDLKNCIGCGACVRACPEDGVLALVHGQAAVVHGARCVGHGLCAEACPTQAIAVTLGDVKERDDLPALDDKLEVVGRPGLFLAGEVTGYALIRTAVAHGAAVAAEVAARARSLGAREPGCHELAIIGAGPAGIACALEARRLGLDFVVLEQETLGGTVSKYPRRKLVMSQPMDLPLHGRLKQTSFEKEELLELWTELVAAHEIPLRTGHALERIDPRVDEQQVVVTSAGTVRARHVCLALGRRGTPRKLGVPGEDLPKVAYSLLDAESYTGRAVLVVGGGDSAVEAALALAEQPGNRVVLSYRKSEFSRLKSRNERRLRDSLAARQLEVAKPSELLRIEEHEVTLALHDAQGTPSLVALPNDEVFIFAGGVAPFELLKRCGVSFDPSQRPSAPSVVERGTGLFRALLVTAALSALALAWVLWRTDYYGASWARRLENADHGWLAPTGAFGLVCGIASLACIATNLLYLLRRSRFGEWLAGSLRHWLSWHMVTGVAATVLAFVHGGAVFHNAAGGHALWMLILLVVTGAIGRYLYAQIPKAANGRELALDEVRARVVSLSAEWDGAGRGFGERMRARVEELVAHSQWSPSFLGRARALFGSQRKLRLALIDLRREAVREGIAASEFDRLAVLARRAVRLGLHAAHFEELRGLLASWRYFHRWIALLMVLVVGLHVATALRYAWWG